MSKQCKDCKHLDMNIKRSVGYLCTNNDRRINKTWGGAKTLSHLKAPTTPACKTGFEPKEVRCEYYKNIIDFLHWR